MTKLIIFTILICLSFSCKMANIQNQSKNILNSFLEYEESVNPTIKENFILLGIDEADTTFVKNSYLVLSLGNAYKRNFIASNYYSGIYKYHNYSMCLYTGHTQKNKNYLIKKILDNNIEKDTIKRDKYAGLINDDSGDSWSLFFDKNNVVNKIFIRNKKDSMDVLNLLKKNKVKISCNTNCFIF